jgi:hypothetical protein
MFNKITLGRSSPAKAPRAQRKIILYFSELGVLCVFAGVIFSQLLQFKKQPEFL